jgi:phosphoribosylglycinamide formyltransferase-1
VTPDLDSGPVLAQATVPIHPGDTPESLAARVREAEHRLYPEALARFLAGPAGTAAAH